MVSFRSVRAGIVDGTVITAALVMLCLYLWDRRAPQAATSPERSAAGLLAEWREEAEKGIRRGSPRAPTTVLAFIDFQCPYCARLLLLLDSLMTERPHELVVVIHHLPLSIHPDALRAAIASECAHQQGAFDRFALALARDGGSLGVRSWRSFGMEAGIADFEGFETCAELPPDSFPRLAHGRALADRIGVRATPTVYLNGRRTSWNTLRSVVERGSGSGTR